MWEELIPMLSGLFKKKLESQASNFGNKLANPTDAFNQYMQQPQPQQSGQQQGGGNWQKFTQPIDTSAGLASAQPNNPMYSQMMQQVMQQQQPQQQRHPMTSVGVAQLPQTGIPQTTMPQMPGAIHPNEDMMSLFKRLMGGG